MRCQVSKWLATTRGTSLSGLKLTERLPLQLAKFANQAAKHGLPCACPMVEESLVKRSGWWSLASLVKRTTLTKQFMCVADLLTFTLHTGQVLICITYMNCVGRARLWGRVRYFPLLPYMRNPKVDVFPFLNKKRSRTTRCPTNRASSAVGCKKAKKRRPPGSGCSNFCQNAALFCASTKHTGIDSGKLSAANNTLNKHPDGKNRFAAGCAPKCWQRL